MGAVENETKDDISITVAQEIAEKLKKDGYMREDPSNLTQRTIENFFNELSEQRYWLTLEGRIFINNGGYAKELKTNRLKYHLRSLEKAILVFGALAAGVYYSCELYKKYLPGCSQKWVPIFSLLIGGIIGSGICLLPKAIRTRTNPMNQTK